MPTCRMSSRESICLFSWPLAIHLALPPNRSSRSIPATGDAASRRSVSSLPSPLAVHPIVLGHRRGYRVATTMRVIRLIVPDVSRLHIIFGRIDRAPITSAPDRGKTQRLNGRLVLKQAMALYIFGKFFEKTRNPPRFLRLNEYVDRRPFTRKRRISSETKCSKTTRGSQAKDSETPSTRKQGKVSAFGGRRGLCYEQRWSEV